MHNLNPDHNLPIIPLIAWDKIYHPKCEGGLGIRKTADVKCCIVGEAKIESFN